MMFLLHDSFHIAQLQAGISIEGFDGLAIFVPVIGSTRPEDVRRWLRRAIRRKGIHLEM